MRPVALALLVLLVIYIGSSACTPAEVHSQGLSFTCPASDPPSFLSSDAEYVCPPGTEGGFPLEWLAPINEDEYPVPFEHNQEMVILNSIIPSKKDRFSVYLNSLYPDKQQDTLSIYRWSWSGPIIALIVIVLFMFQLPTVARSIRHGDVDKRTERFACLDMTGRFGIDVRTLRSPTSDTFESKGHKYVAVYKRKTAVGGLVTCCFLLTFFALVLSVEMLVLATPSPNLPNDIVGDLYPDCLLQREVTTTPLSGLSAGTSAVLNQWTLEHDNLYVTEVVGGDWGTVCLDRSLLEGLSFGDVLQVVYAASSGLLPPSLQSPSPTPIDTLREAGAIGLTTDNCTLLGSKLDCSEAFTNDALYDSLHGPVMAYGCYQDALGVFHHLTLMTMALHPSIPQGDAPEYSMRWAPTDEYPRFGTHAAGIKQHVLPPGYNRVGGGPVDAITSPFRSLFEADMDELVVCGWMHPLHYTKYNPLDDPRLQECFSEDGTIKHSVHSLFGAPQRENVAFTYAWDDARLTSCGVGPYPAVTPHQRSLMGCELVCVDGDTCYYQGGLCSFFVVGLTLAPDGGSGALTPDQLDEILPYVEIAQPDGVLCPDNQSFHVLSEIGYARGGAGRWEPLSTTEGAENAPFEHYATSYNTLSYVEASICQGGTEVTPDRPLSVSVVRQFSTEAVVVDFVMPGLWDVVKSYILLIISFLAFHAIIMAILRTLMRKRIVRHHKGKADKHADLPPRAPPSSSHFEESHSETGSRYSLPRAHGSHREREESETGTNRGSRRASLSAAPIHTIRASRREGSETGGSRRGSLSLVPPNPHTGSRRSVSHSHFREDSDREEQSVSLVDMMSENHETHVEVLCTPYPTPTTKTIHRTGTTGDDSEWSTSAEERQPLLMFGDPHIGV
ncbi:hypothetical protein KIPB_002867 [Kipferlia bialata]|uniref:Uncharacterized protein n=1 Tax=Kipferlia bialata TaxID=797122 RepID=A0A9K3GGA5_9EUKA|nr:hypothetical protein KIPB_002867 [Kipferlia bialata]|eukprot:g2867.t1